MTKIFIIIFNEYKTFGQDRKIRSSMILCSLIFTPSIVFLRICEGMENVKPSIKMRKPEEKYSSEEIVEEELSLLAVFHFNEDWETTFDTKTSSLCTVHY